MRWSVRYGYKRRQARLRRKQSLLYSQILETGDIVHRSRPHRKDTRVVRRQKSGARERFRSQPLLGFPQERQSRAECIV